MKLHRLADDLLAECEELDRFVSTLDDADWLAPTSFFAWTPRDEILHLHQLDRAGLASFESPEAFDRLRRAMREAQARGLEFSQQARDEAVGWSRAEVMARWREGYRALVRRCRDTEARARLSWFGPDMSAMSFATARLMEVWAHGQDIYDLKAAPRAVHPRIRNICELGLRTFGWTFSNRQMPVPPRPSVTLTLPDGEVLDWPGEGGGEVRGLAADFALVVTQRRPVEETGLATVGEAAASWMRLAQCFAGPPQARAEPGERPAFRAL